MCEDFVESDLQDIHEPRESFGQFLIILQETVYRELLDFHPPLYFANTELQSMNDVNRIK